MSKKLFLILICLNTYAFAKAQDTFHNFGDVKIHTDGQIGFHGDLINDGDFDQNNRGLAGFYNVNNSLSVSGNNKPIFYNMEVNVPNDLNFNVSVGVDNFLDFIDGRIITPRQDLNVNLDFANTAVYLGESDSNHVDGYTAIAGDLEFIFPIGDDFKLRTLTVIPLDPSTTGYQAAYFFENPTTPSTLSGSFNVNNFQNNLSIINPNEYWDLNGDLPVRATLTWDEDTDIPLLADELSSLRVVGFSEALNRWVDLGNTAFSGDDNTGEITSDVFEPNLFSALTFGSILRGNGAITVYTAFSPNNDGINDTFVIEGLETSPGNELLLFNRWGVEVYSKKDYDNSFNGTSNGRSTIQRNENLPEGTYYYVLKLKDQTDIAGYFYINR